MWFHTTYRGYIESVRQNKHHHYHHRYMLDVGRCPLCPDPSIRGKAFLCSWTSLDSYSTSCPVLIRTLWRWATLPLLTTKYGFTTLTAERLHNVYGGKNLWNWTKPTETSRMSVVRDVADRFLGWQQLTNYRDPEKKIGALGGDILKKQRFFENYAK